MYVGVFPDQEKRDWYSGSSDMMSCGSMPSISHTRIAHCNLLHSLLQTLTGHSTSILLAVPIIFFNTTQTSLKITPQNITQYSTQKATHLVYLNIIIASSFMLLTEYFMLAYLYTYSLPLINCLVFELPYK